MSTAFDIVESRTFLTPAPTGKHVYDLFAANPDLLCLAIVARGRPLGLINRNAFFMRFGDELGLRRRAHHRRQPASAVAD